MGLWVAWSMADRPHPQLGKAKPGVSMVMATPRIQNRVEMTGQSNQINYALCCTDQSLPPIPR